MGASAPALYVYEHNIHKCILIYYIHVPDIIYTCTRHQENVYRTSGPHFVFILLSRLASYDLDVLFLKVISISYIKCQCVFLS